MGFGLITRLSNESLTASNVLILCIRATRIVLVIGCDANGHELCLPTSLGSTSFAQAGFNAFTGALAIDLRDHVFGKWIETVAVWVMI